MTEPHQFQCRWCESNRGRVLIPTTDTTHQPWKLVRCDDCRWISLTPWPTDAQLNAAYSESYYGVGEQKFDGPVERVLNRFREGRARHCARMLPQGGSVLDVGCGNGGFLAAIGRHGSFELHGVEMPGKAAERAAQRSGLNLHVGPFGEQFLEDRSFDLVTLFHVFEHLPAPRQTLETITRILKPGGHVVLSMPNIASVQARLFGRYWLHLDPPRHLHFAAPREFRNRATDCGLTVREERYWSLEQNPFGFIQSALNTFLPARDLLYERLKGNDAYAPEYGPGSLFLQKAFAGLVLGPAIALDALESGLSHGATVEYTLRKILPP